MQTLVESPLEKALMNVFLQQKSKVKELRTESSGNRIERLKQLRNWIHSNRSQIHEAMYSDFKKHPVEVDGIEIFHVLSEIKTAISN
ncbi:MAG TPA: hypothetical protein VFG46_09720, partial [Chryseolinea sp.]|nr:hypothetical protein [Chryseolinea sp.]